MALKKREFKTHTILVSGKWKKVLNQKCYIGLSEFLIEEQKSTFLKSFRPLFNSDIDLFTKIIC